MTEPFKDNIHTFAESTIRLVNEIIDILHEYEKPSLTPEEQASLLHHRGVLIESVKGFKRDIGTIGIEPLYILSIAATTALFGQYKDAAVYIIQAKSYKPSTTILNLLNRLDLEITKKRIAIIAEENKS